MYSPVHPPLGYGREAYIAPYTSYVHPGIYHPGIPPPYYTSLGTPPYTPTRSVPSGTLSPPVTVRDDEALGSNLGYSLGERLSGASLPLILLGKKEASAQSCSLSP